MTIRHLLLVSTILILVTCLFSCKDDDDTDLPNLPNTSLSANEITISDIAGIPANITFNKIKVEISGVDWETIGIIEAPFQNGEATLTLPTSFSAEKLMKVVRADRFDYTGFWYASTDNSNAKVAGLRDICAYNNDEKVGLLDLTDWPGEGSAEFKSHIYYHYTDQPYTLTAPDGDNNNKGYKYNASFVAGWNAYAIINQSDRDIETDKPTCSAPVSEEVSLTWRFIPLQ